MFALAACAASLSAEDWPQFRGPNAAGISRESKNLPVEFSHQDKVLWSLELGEGIACPIVTGGKVIATTMIDQQTFGVYCLEAATGKELWRRELDTGATPAIMPPNAQASSTPATDGERVYVYFSTLGMLALDITNGETVWEHKIPEPFYLLGWGAAHSPIVYKDLLVFNQDDDLSPFMIALDKRTGEVRWKTPRAEMLAGYAVPVICKANGREDIVIAGSGKLKGYDPATGDEL